ncbi:MAG TPA: sterol desaturase, partial [Marinobacter adhaerens]|nr:sterol desaturase [Marinobacter adhaerens]
AAGHIGMVIGIEDFREPRDLRLDQMLIQPFRSTYRRP